MSTVKIVSEFVGGTSEGTGILADTEGRVVTCAHVVKEGQSGEIRWVGIPNLNVVYRTLAIGDIDSNDVAILQTEPNLYQTLAQAFQNVLNITLKESFLPKFEMSKNEVKAGTLVAVCGYPTITPRLEKGMGGKGQHPPTISVGVITSSLFGEGPTLVSAPVYPGNSGGPVFKEDGTVVGIMKANVPLGEMEVQGMHLWFPSTYGIMIPIAEVQNLAEKNDIVIGWTTTKRRTAS